MTNVIEQSASLSALNALILVVLTTTLLGRMIVKGADITYQLNKRNPRVSEEDVKRRATLIYSLAKLMRFVLWIAAVIFLGSYIGVPSAVLTTIGTVLGAGIGFGSQTLVADIIKGLVRVGEKHAEIHDLVTVDVSGTDPVTGTVVDITMLSLKVKTELGEEINIPHSSIITIKNLSRVGTFKASLSVPSGVDIDEAVARVGEAVSSLKEEDPSYDELTCRGVTTSEAGFVTIQIYGQTRADLKYEKERLARRECLSALQPLIDEAPVLAYNPLAPRQQ